MTFESLRRYRPAVFLAGDDIDIPFRVRLLRGLVVFGLAWIATVFTYPFFHGLVGSPEAERAALDAFNTFVEKEHAERAGKGIVLPKLLLRGVSAASDEDLPYQRIAEVTFGAPGREVAVHTVFSLLEVRRGQPRWWMPTIRPVSQPVSIHPVLGSIASMAVEPKNDTLEPVDEEVTMAWVITLQEAYEAATSQLGWRPTLQRRLDGGIQFGTFWLFYAVAIVLMARFACHILPDRRLRRVTELGDDADDDGPRTTPWMREDGEAQDLLALYKEASARFDHATSWLGCRIQSPFLELRRFAIAAFLVAENISQIPAFLETKANSLIDRQQAGLALARYLIWAIPTLGFIGTVVGIGESLELTRDLQGLQPLRVAVAKSSVSTSIGVAFDTTFVALVLSLPAMFLFNVLQGLEEMSVIGRKDEAIDDLTHLENAKPFRCHASRVADSLERLGLTAEVLERQLAQIPQAAKLAPERQDPWSPPRRRSTGWLWILLSIAVAAAIAAWQGGWITI